MEEEADDCYSPAFPLDRFKHSRYLQMVEERAEEVNRHNLPPEVKHTMILHVKYVQSYVQMGFPYRLHLALAQIDDKKQNNQRFQIQTVCHKLTLGPCWQKP